MSCLGFFIFLTSTPYVFADKCNDGQVDEFATVERVLDGDTVVLGDGRHIRLIGINAPEIGETETSLTVFARQVRDDLHHQFDTNKRVGIKYDAEHYDRYKRVLAHLYREDGTSIQSWLLERGLATMTVIPPNVDNLSCYSASERKARSLGRGLWSMMDYQPIASTRLTPDVNGFRLVHGRVINIEESSESIWLNLEGDVGLRIDRDDLHYFYPLESSFLQNRQLIARGWLYRNKDKSSGMRVRHPASLEWRE